MTRSMEEWLEFYNEMLEEELGRSDSSLSGICMFASAIARISDLSNQQEEAKNYFSMAAQACLDDLEQDTGQTQTTPKSRGDDRLRCGQILWRAGDDRADSYIRQALEEYRKGYDSESDLDRAFCWGQSAYCLIFLEDYLTAAQAIRKGLDLKKDLDHPIIRDPSEIVIEVVMSLEEGDKAVCVEAISHLEAFMKRRKISIYGMNPPFIVDVYEFLKRKVEEME